MRAFFFSLVAIALTVCAQGAPVTLEWDPLAPKSEAEYTVYELSVATLPIEQWIVGAILHARTVQSRVTINVEPGLHIFFVTARNYWGESAPSNTATTPPVIPGPPVNFRIVSLLMLEDGTVKLSVNGTPWTQTRIEASTDLRTWKTIFSRINVTGGFEFVDGAAVRFTQRFYRAGAVPL
jgi:hypothetical protein